MTIEQLRAALDAIDPMSMGEPIKGKTYKADGWVYRDISWTTMQNWKQLTDIIGEGNYVALAQSTRGKSRDDPDAEVRGQMIVSPDGLARAAAWAKERAK